MHAPVTPYHILPSGLRSSHDHAHELDMPGLRSWPLKRYSWPVFYAERDDHVDLWRVLRAERDLPEWMRAGAGRLNP